MQRSDLLIACQGMQRRNASNACTECRTRKIKCDGNGLGPCANCTKLELECKTRADGRKDRYRSQKIERLESTVADYQRLFEQINKSHQNTTDLLRAMGRKRRPNGPETPHSVAPSQEPVVLRAERTYFSQKGFPKERNTYLPMFGPTSALDAEESQPREHTAEIRQLRERPEIIECIRLFFRWQYPDMHSFIFREAFLLDFFDANSPGVYSSAELVYAICCVGASMAEDVALKDLASSFYRNSREMLLTVLDSPSISSLQAFMLLGLYDIYNANINTGWMLTGDAIRMGYGIGFHLRPQNWLLRGDNQNDEISNNVRSRIFWGTFTADRFISLILGRPSVIKMDASTIPIAANMPALEWIAPYTYPGAPDDDKTPYIDISNPLLNIVKLAKISDDMMENVFTRSTGQSDAKCDPSIEEKLNLIKNYNEKLLRWRDELPVNLRWTRQMLQDRGHNNNEMFLRYFYYMVLLCLNRPFVDVRTRVEEPSGSLDSLAICTEIIGDLHCCIHSFIKLNGASKCSVLIVYSCIISLSVLLMMGHEDYSEMNRRWFYEFMLVLKYTTHWRLSHVSYNKLKIKFEKTLDVPFEHALKAYAEQVETDGASLFSVLKHHEKSILLDPENGDSTYSNPESHSGIEDFSSFGGPPVFMTSEINDWINLFPEMLDKT